MTPRDRRAVLWGIALVGAALLVRGVPQALGAYRKLNSRVAIESDQLARARADVAGLPALEGAARRARAELVALAPKLVSGATPAEASADLAGRVRAAADERHLRFERLEPLADSTHVGELRQAAVRVAAESDTRGAVELLASLARAPAALTLFDLRLTTADGAASLSEAESVRIEMVVRGWYFAPGWSP